MAIQVPLLTIVGSSSGMSACSRTRRVTHLTLDDARVEMRYQIWNFRRLFGVSERKVLETGLSGL